MTYYRKLVGEKCFLSPISTEDAACWATWFNDLEVSLPLGDEAYAMRPLELEQQDVSEMIRIGSHSFAIVDLQTDRLIGRCLLFGINQVNRSANLGIVIGEKDYWGKGYGLDSVRLLLDYGFNLLNLNSIMLGAFEFNQRAIACYLKAGFREIGRRRQARIIAGRKYDGVLMDILAEEFVSPFVRGLMQKYAE